MSSRQTDESSMDGVRVRVLFFGAAKEIAGEDEVELKISTPATVSSAFEDIIASFPKLREKFGRSLLFAVNQEYKKASTPVNAGDELAVFPPVSGGSTEINTSDFFELTTEVIDVGNTARRVVRNECGATVSLDGYVREMTKGRKTLYLIYEAYAPMALKEMRRLGEEAHRRFDISHIGIVHRTGRMEIGETSVVISVGAAHRNAAFEACEWAIKELKRTVPIWKKEFFEDGEVWVEGEGSRILPEPDRNG